jgi:hypothetical protein
MGINLNYHIFQVLTFILKKIVEGIHVDLRKGKVPFFVNPNFLIFFIIKHILALHILLQRVSSTNKTDCHDITEMLLKVALNTIPYLSLITEMIFFQLFNRFQIFSSEKKNIPKVAAHIQNMLKIDLLKRGIYMYMVSEIFHLFFSYFIFKLESSLLL